MFAGQSRIRHVLVQVALFNVTETRNPKGFKISCNVASVGLPFLEFGLSTEAKIS